MKVINDGNDNIGFNPKDDEGCNDDFDGDGDDDDGGDGDDDGDGDEE